MNFIEPAEKVRGYDSSDVVFARGVFGRMAGEEKVAGPFPDFRATGQLLNQLRRRRAVQSNGRVSVGIIVKAIDKGFDPAAGIHAPKCIGGVAEVFPKG